MLTRQDEPSAQTSVPGPDGRCCSWIGRTSFNYTDRTNRIRPKWPTGTAGPIGPGRQIGLDVQSVTRRTVWGGGIGHRPNLDRTGRVNRISGTGLVDRTGQLVWLGRIGLEQVS